MPQNPQPSPFWQQGFRPLFLLMGLYALLAPIPWLMQWTGTLALPGAPQNPWLHGHAMLMGMAGAAIAGFLLTAVPNWTSTTPVRGLPLACLCLFWLIGRLGTTPGIVLVADLAFWCLLWGLIAVPILRSANRRNYKVLIAVMLLAGTDALVNAGELMEAPWLRQAVWAQLWLIVLLINLIGGRIIPAFTGNWMKRRDAALTPQQLPAPFSAPDLAGGLAIAAFAVLVTSGAAPAPTVTAGAVATVLQFIRLLRWKPWRTLSDPLVWMLHLSWLWLVAGTALWTASTAGLLPVSAAVHALGIGAIGSMIVSVSSRAILGHTGRTLRSHPLLTGAILAISAAAVARIIATTSDDNITLWISSTLWSAAFIAWLLRHAPILLRDHAE